MRSLLERRKKSTILPCFLVKDRIDISSGWRYLRFLLFFVFILIVFTVILPVRINRLIVYSVTSLNILVRSWWIGLCDSAKKTIFSLRAPSTHRLTMLLFSLHRSRSILILCSSINKNTMRSCIGWASINLCCLSFTVENRLTSWHLRSHRAL